MEAFLRAYAERKAEQATTEADVHINRENALLAASQRWDNKRAVTLRKLASAGAALAYQTRTGGGAGKTQQRCHRVVGCAASRVAQLCCQRPKLILCTRPKAASS